MKTRAARFHSGGEVLGELDLGLTGSRYGFDLGSPRRSPSGPHRAPESARRVGHPLDPADRSRPGPRRRRRRRSSATARPSEVAVDWVVGCDGLHSMVRELAGIEFPGSDIEAPWAVFDAAVDGWSEEHDVAAAFLDVPPVILTPLPGRRWRSTSARPATRADLVEEATAVVRRYVPEVKFERGREPGAVPLPLARRRALSRGPRPARRRRRPRLHPGRGPRDEHRPPGRLQPRLEARAGLPGSAGERPARQLRARAPAGRRAGRRVGRRRRGEPGAGRGGGARRARRRRSARPSPTPRPRTTRPPRRPRSTAPTPAPRSSSATPKRAPAPAECFRTASTSTHRPPATPPSSTCSHTDPGTSWSSSAARRPTPRPWPRSWPRRSGSRRVAVRRLGRRRSGQPDRPAAQPDRSRRRRAPRVRLGDAARNPPGPLPRAAPRRRRHDVLTRYLEGLRSLVA